MPDSIKDKDDAIKNPNEDSIVTDNTQGGKKVDANSGKEVKQPGEDDQDQTVKKTDDSAGG